MGFRVIIQRAAVRDMDETLRWLQRRAPGTASRWYVRLTTHILDLANSASTCAKARESRFTTRLLRESHFGRRPNIFRIIFLIEDDAIRVLRVIRAQRRGLTRKQIDQAIDEGSRNSGKEEM